MADSARLQRRHAALVAEANNADSDLSSRRGDLAMAIPHHRSLYLTTFIMRVVSASVSISIISIIASYESSFTQAYYAIYYWAFGSPTAGLALLWSLIDITVLLIKDRGLILRQSDRRKKRRRRAPGSAFCWGKPGVHMCAHLLIWAVSLALGVILWMNWFFALESDRYPPYVAEWDAETNTFITVTPVTEPTTNASLLWKVPLLQIILT